jgi:Flp pilus assembly protein TadG
MHFTRATLAAAAAPVPRTGDTATARLRGDRGAAVVEFALVGPLLFTLLMGIIDFGVGLTNEISVHQGVREAARQGAVANFGPTSSCGATFTTPGSDNMQRLICLTKARTDVIAAPMSVAVRFGPNSTSYTAPSSGSPVGNDLVVCSAVPLRSLSGAFAPMLRGAYIRSKAVMRIEKASSSTAGEQPANEADPTDGNWSWCTP